MLANVNCCAYPHLLLADFIITLTTMGKPQGVFVYVIFFAFMASSVILTNEWYRFLQNIIPVSVLL